jgi:ribulose-phosphate 3-epimerase
MSLPPVKISPSLLSADFVNLARDVAAVEDAGADWLHVDVMDGHFVPNLTIGLPVVKALKRVARRPLDVHIMIENPLAEHTEVNRKTGEEETTTFAQRYVQAGADVLTCHLETQPDALDAIRAAGGKAGLAVNPGTDIAPVRDYLGRLDMVLVMSVQPGFGGQSFRRDVLDKAEALRSWGFEGDVQMDGGIAPDTVADAASAGVNVFVAGSAIFGSDDWAATIATLRETAESVHAARA